MNTATKKIRSKILKENNIDGEELDKLVEKKIRDLRGYISEVGAYYLVATELGVSSDVTVSVSNINELYGGATKIAISGVVEKIGDIESIQTKNGEQKIRNMIIRDNTGWVKAVCWGSAAEHAIFQKLTPGDHLMISNVGANSKGNNISVNVGQYSEITKPSTKDTIQPSEIVRLGDYGDTDAMTISCVVASGVDEMTYGDDGSQKALRFDVRAISSEVEYSVVIWGQNMTDISGTASTDKPIELSCVNVSHEDNEIRGDTMSTIHGNASQESTKLKILKSTTPEQNKPMTCIAIDENRRRWFVTCNQAIAGLDSGTILECTPKVTGVSTMHLSDTGDTAVSEMSTEEYAAVLKSARSRISDCTLTPPHYVSVICVTEPNEKDRTMKNGKTTKLGSIRVNDMSGLARLQGWGKQSKRVMNLEVGKRYDIFGVVGKEYNDEVNLTITNKTIIEPLD